MSFITSMNAFRSIARRSFSIRAYLAADGQGRGTGGSTRDGGGVLSQKESAGENSYFRKIESEQLEALGKKHDEEIKHHEEEIKRLKESIKRHRQEKEALKKK